MRSMKAHHYTFFIWVLLWLISPAVIGMAQERVKESPGTTVDAWRQSLPRDAEAPGPAEENPETAISSPSREETQKILLTLETKWMDSLRASDADSLGEIIAADFSFASPRMKDVKDRIKYLEHALRDLKVTSYEFEKITVRPFGRTAIVSGLLKQNATVKGEDWAGTYLVTDVWINRNGIWRAVSRHESLVK